MEVLLTATVWILGLTLGLLLLGFLYQHVGSLRDTRRFPPPGRRVDIGGYRLHLIGSGQGSPTVVFESALGATCLTWSLVQSEVARLTTTVSYDRAGCGWSDQGPMPRSVEQILQELRLLLRRSSLEPPYLLVGHSYGGLTVRLFAHRYPDEVAGALLLDPADPEQWLNLKGEDRAKIVNGARLSRRGVWLARFGLARLVVSLGSAGAQSPARGLASFLSEGVPRAVQDRLLSPMQRLPQEARDVLKWFWTRPAYFQALASQIEWVSQSAQQVRLSPLPPELPLTVISAPNSDPQWMPGQEKTAALSSRGKHLVARDSSHWIPLDRPDLVVETLCQMVEEARIGMGGSQR